MADDKDEGRMLIAFSALVDGQKRTLRMVESAIERYFTIETEITKLHRNFNISQESTARNQSENALRFDAMQDTILRNQGEVASRFDAMQDVAARNQSEIGSRFDAMQDAILRDQGEVASRFDAMQDAAARNQSEIGSRFDVMQDAILRNQGEVASRFDAMQDTILRNQSDVLTRLDAISARLEEVERLEDDRAGEIKQLHIELSSQYNDILTALQMASNSVADTKEFRERLEQLERRLGL